jgi:HD-GYP domain-containing protein (c-di-GMP phosphodiesterase class II)
MYQTITVNLSNLLLSLSDALDLASPVLAQHQMRTAFISWEIAKAAGLPQDQTESLYMAALLHDVGALSAEEKIAIHQHEVLNPDKHCILGEKLLRTASIFEYPSRIVRFHHTPWKDWRNPIEEPLVRQAQILKLADTLERGIDRDSYILHQQDRLIERAKAAAGDSIHPDVVQWLVRAGVREEFWLDLVSPRLYSLLLHNGPCRGVEIGLSRLSEISELFRNMIDFRSRFTSTHSSGVAASATILAKLFGLTEMEIGLMEIAGNLHDIGKMAIPNQILEKPGKLTREEFAVIRQHTYLTYTILNSIGGIQQIVEWAAFHHEKLDGSGYPFHVDAQKIGIGSRIMAVADIFTALAENRPYREAMDTDGVMGIIRKLSENRQLDSRVVGVLADNYETIRSEMRERQQAAREYFEKEFYYPDPPASSISPDAG